MRVQTDYSQLTTEELNKEYNRLKTVIDDAYQRFTRAAASRCGVLVNIWCEAGAERRKIKEELENRKTIQWEAGRR